MLHTKKILVKSPIADVTVTVDSGIAVSVWDGMDESQRAESTKKAVKRMSNIWVKAGE